MINTNSNCREENLMWEGIVRQYNDALIKYCYSILCNYADAEDAVQMTFIKIITKSHLIHDKKALGAYLYKSAYHTAIDIIRNRKLKLYADVKEYAHGVTARYDDEFPEELRTALQKLEPFERALLFERTVNGTGYRELAEFFHKSEGNLRKRYERIRKKMRSYLNVPAAKLSEGKGMGKVYEGKIYY